MGRIAQFSKRPDASHIAPRLAAVCFAGLILTIDAQQAQADLAPIAQATLGAAPESPHLLHASGPDRSAVGPAHAAILRLPPITVSIVSKTLELRQLAPEAFDDWEFPTR